MMTSLLEGGCHETVAVVAWTSSTTKDSAESDVAASVGDAKWRSVRAAEVANNSTISSLCDVMVWSEEEKSRC